MFRILLPVDGSGYALQAVDYAKRLLERMDDAEVTVLTVADIGQLPVTLLSEQPENAVSSLDVSPGIREIFQKMDAESEIAAKGAQGRLLPCHRPVYTRTARGEPWKVICDIAERDKFDLIIMGSAGKGFVAGIVLGSVSNRVLHHCKVPMLVVPGKAG
ncbi:MAG: universal stress protein [Chloroflexi bacterium]|nr:universal stress protein [Chloroflexota bacterium]